jgi:phosphoglycolate phosphatase
MINTLILDLDGPILDGKLRHYQCYRDILMEHGFEPMPMDIYWEMKRQRKDRHSQLAVNGANGIYKEFLNAWLERIEQKKYLNLDQLQPGAFEKLKEWQTIGMDIILVTMRNSQDNLYWQLSVLNLTSLFNFIHVVGTANRSTSKVSAVRPHVEQAGRSSVLWIGDTEVDAEAARVLGVTSCLVSCGLRVPEYLATLNPDYLLPGLELANFLI